MEQRGWQAVVIAVALIALVGVFFVVGIRETNSMDDFLKAWVAVGTIVGVVAGTIPAFFFKSQADKATDAASNATADAAKADARFSALAAVAEPTAVKSAIDVAPEAFKGWKRP